jgi:hypothetical protein
MIDISYCRKFILQNKIILGVIIVLKINFFGSNFNMQNLEAKNLKHL